ncbi:hypothetical protein [Gilvimarinus polysaccharolyticus]|uniref:hypothetical protein n=1 Tax=Gilvimarinus polysaccharolyticus TaxID=863921 RepID=UPI000673C13B|nr:hypothetical protein [Gilvimarinus polysaccharolyticus]
MYQSFLRLLMFVILLQSTLAAADAHLLHEASGELSHHHSLIADMHDNNAVQPLVAGQFDDTNTNTDQSCHHHCCHGHNAKYLNGSLVQPNISLKNIADWAYDTHYVPPTATAKYRPPIV